MFLLTCFTIRAFLFLQGAWGLSDDWRVLVSLMFIYIPVGLARWTGREVDPDVLWPEPLWPALKSAAWMVGKVALLLYPFFFLGNHLWQTSLLPWVTREILHFRHPISPHYPVHGLPHDLLLIVVWQLVAVAYAEEFFYRGWMQTRLQQAFPETRQRFLTVPLGAPFWITATLFTLGHSLVMFQWWQPFIFFPALFFGWLRGRTGNILAGTLFHALANVVMIVLDTLYGVRPP